MYPDPDLIPTPPCSYQDSVVLEQMKLEEKWRNKSKFEKRKKRVKEREKENC